MDLRERKKCLGEKNLICRAGRRSVTSTPQSLEIDHDVKLPGATAAAGRNNQAPVASGAVKLIKKNSHKSRERGWPKSVHAKTVLYSAHTKINECLWAFYGALFPVHFALSRRAGRGYTVA